MQSCVDSIPIPIEEVDAMLVFESDINNQTGFSAKISTSANLADVSTTSHPKDLKVVISNLSEHESPIQLFYDEGRERYINSAKPKRGTNYLLVASYPGNEFYKEITATMVFPRITRPLELEAIRDIHTDGSTSVNTSITLDGNVNSSNYYHIVPYRKVTDIVESGGELVEEYRGGETKPLILLDSDNNDLYLEQLHNQDGFLVDFKDRDIALNTLNVLLHTEEGDIIDYENQAFTQVFFEVRSVTKSYYDYIRWQSNVLAVADGNSVNIPIIDNTITNGFGFFGSYNMVMDSIPVQ